MVQIKLGSQSSNTDFLSTEFFSFFLNGRYFQSSINIPKYVLILTFR